MEMTKNQNLQHKKNIAENESIITNKENVFLSEEKKKN